MSAPTRDDDSCLDPPRTIKILLVDDEERFRFSLRQRLALRGFEVLDVGDPEEAVRAVRQHRPDVVVLDRKMPKLSGEEVLKEIKRISPEIQVIMLTGHATMDSAAASGRLDAFAYLEKPCETEGLVATIQAAHREKLHAMARHEIPQKAGRSIWNWLKGTHNLRPGVMLLGAVVMATAVLAPAPANMLLLLGTPKTADAAKNKVAGYADYRKMDPGQTVAQYYSKASKRSVKLTAPDGTVTKRPLTPQETGQKAMVMIGTLVVAALFWATGALPIGITALLVGVLMYLFGVFPPDLVAKAYAKDAVIFILGVLALAAGISKTGLDRRIGLLLLGTSRSLGRFLFLFLPLLAVTASFLSEHALVAFIAPILMVVYKTAVREAGIPRDRALATMFILSLCMVANQGGPGSPAAGGRNAVMISILADYGMAPSFAEWVKYGLPFVPVMALTIAAYFFLRFRGQVKVKQLDVARIVRRESDRIGKMTREELICAVVLLGVITLWITLSHTLGMGGPALIGICALAMVGIITWPDVNKISWDVVALYASATAIGAGLAVTGAAIWIADSFVAALPQSLSQGNGLAIACSLFTGVMTNFMSDGATVSALGPVVVPMARISGTHPWKVGFATAFASSFANAFIIGTPNNAIAYSLAKDLDTGEQLVSLGDFAKHGVVVTCLAWLVLWFWCIHGYWNWVGFSPL